MSKLASLTERYRPVHLFKPPPPEVVLSLPGLPNSGGIILDSSPYGNNGTITGATWTRLPSGLWALSFDGDDYITLPRFALSGTVLTFETWANTTLHTTIQTFIGDAGQSATIGFIWCYRPANSANLVWQYAQGAGNDIATAAGFFTGYDGKWLQIKVICDYTNKVTTLYRNGNLHTTAAMTNTPVFPSTNRVRYLGAYSLTQFRLQNGKLALVKLSTAAQIANIYNQERHLLGV